MVLHHTARPELAMAEMTRVTRLGGTLLIVDQVAPLDPLAALELNRFEAARDPSHVRALTDQDLRGLFEANNLVVIRDELLEEHRGLGSYLDLAGCTGPERERAQQLGPGPRLVPDHGRLVRAGEAPIRRMTRIHLVRVEIHYCPV